jgi:LacI family transcriptional regulator
MRKSVTRDDVARAAGVSTATVSYVVNNGPRPVSEETRKKVLKVIKNLGYRPNTIARNLRRQRTSTLGLILPDTYNPYFAEVARAVEQTAFDRGFTVILCHSDYTLERELHYVDVLQAERAAGVIWFPATGNAEPGNRLAEYDIPLVVLDRSVEGMQASAVVADNFRGGYLATQHLIDLGHHRIGCITRPFELHHSQERARGYRAALEDHGFSPDERLTVRGGFRLDDGCQAARTLLSMELPPTAIFAYNDFMAIGALRAAVECGLKVPEDLSIVGFDDIPQSAFTCPALTTIRLPKHEMGCKGAELLLDLIDGKSPPAERSAPLDVKLIVRESSGQAPVHR